MLLNISVYLYFYATVLLKKYFEIKLNTLITKYMCKITSALHMLVSAHTVTYLSGCSYLNKKKIMHDFDCVLFLQEKEIGLS